MSTGTVSLERRDHVLLIGIDRPAKRNAFDLPMWDALCRAYGELDRDPALRVGVLHAVGDHFTGGLDLPQWGAVFSSGAWQIPEGGLDALGMTGPRLRKPIVAAVQGTCLTIGIELLLATDIRVAARTTKFGQIEVKRGIYPVGGATLRFPREVGWGNAMRWLLTGDEYDATEAHRIGLVQEVADDGPGAVRRALEIAHTIAERSAPLGVRTVLASAHRARDDGDAAAIEHLNPDVARLFASDDGREGITSFVERRDARFTGH